MFDHKSKVGVKNVDKVKLHIDKLMDWLSFFIMEKQMGFREIGCGIGQYVVFRW